MNNRTMHYVQHKRQKPRPGPVPPNRRYKKHRSPIKILITIILLSMALLVFLVGLIYAGGYRYIKVEVPAGGTVKFVGRTEDGEPLKGRIIYSNGLTGTYDRSQGTVVYSNGDVYTGSLKNLMKNGKGKIVYANGASYEGDFYNDAITGEGPFIFENGDTYTGGFLDGKKHGQGTYTWE